MAEKKKRTAEQVRRYIAERAARASKGIDNTMVTGPDLARIAPKIDLIPDKQLRTEVHNLITSVGKYAALDMLIHPSGKYYRKHAELMEEIALEATEADAAAITATSRLGAYS